MLFYFNLGLLTKVGVRNGKQLTPKCKKLYSITNQLLKQYRHVGCSKELFKNRLRAAENFSDSYLKDTLVNKTTVAASLFTRLQIRETNKKNKGRRFTIEEKILSLSLYKKSPKCYRLLSNLFTLPCRRTLNDLLSNVKIKPGVSPTVLRVLTEKVTNLKPSER